LGVLGSGQLGRMFAIAARRMGYRVHTLSPGIDDTLYVRYYVKYPTSGNFSHNSSTVFRTRFCTLSSSI